MFCFCVWSSFIGAALSVIKVYRSFPEPSFSWTMCRKKLAGSGTTSSAEGPGDEVGSGNEIVLEQLRTLLRMTARRRS